ncbi:tetraspanin-19 [Microcaecilia unicolor]|uniref:Tetraspanin n=1 Tax=Microcaecilia unicolor TaxID=1415580 RepID=A0A6P7YU53_9AMPH|nr:putative tetraspanin-19 [Microcaecilia unicolor]
MWAAAGLRREPLFFRRQAFEVDDFKVSACWPFKQLVEDLEATVNKMNTKDQIYILTYFFYVLNGFFMIIGLLQMGFGVWILYDKNSFFTALVYADTKNNEIMDIAYILLYNGVFIIVPFLVGYLGVMKDSRCLLILYMVIIALMSILQFSIIILLLSQRDNFKKKMISNFKILINEYGNYSLYEAKKHTWELLNVVQNTHSCCGISNSSDWEKNTYVAEHEEIPCSCTDSALTTWFCEPSYYQIFIAGCEGVVTNWFFKNLYVLLSIECGLFILKVFLLLLTVFLLKLVKKKTTVSIKV